MNNKNDSERLERIEERLEKIECRFDKIENRLTRLEVIAENHLKQHERTQKLLLALIPTLIMVITMFLVRVIFKI